MQKSLNMSFWILATVTTFFFFSIKPSVPPEDTETVVEKHYINEVGNIYKHASLDVIKDAVKSAEKYQYEDFPKTHDIIAIVGIESSWNPDAESNLKKDPAKGLTQIRHEVWRNLIDDADMHIVENQIKFSAYILHENYVKFHDRAKAIIAYNQGMGTVIKTKWAKIDKSYLHKFNQEYLRIRKHDGNIQ